LPLSGSDALAGEVHKLAKSDDIVVCLGAGDITYWAHALPDGLNALINKSDNGGNG